MSIPRPLAGAAFALLLALAGLPLSAADVDEADVDLTLSARGQSFTNGLGMKMMPIPAGKFMMGSPGNEKERAAFEDRHEVEISKPFFLAATEVTQAQWRKVMGNNPAGFSRNGGSAPDVRAIKDADLDSFPVETVSWQDVQVFLKKLNAREGEAGRRREYRLPTEAQWEYACRAGTTTRFHFGDTITPKNASFNGNGLQRPVKVASYPPNAFGLYDVHGNVWEWCHDFYDDAYYKVSPRLDPFGPDKGDNHVMRGGCWFDGSNYCRSACRLWNSKGIRADRGLGFRVALVSVR